MYKSGAFSQNTAAPPRRSSQVEPFSETPLGAASVREKLSGSAAALFQRFGYTHVSVRDITSSIDIPKGTFYNHFKSKEALAAAILSQHFDALMEALGQGGSETTGARLRRHFESIAPSTREHRLSPLQLISTFSAEGPALPSALVLQIAEGVRAWNTKVAALISRAQEDGEINAEEDPDLLAALFINCWQGAMIRTKCDPSAPGDCLRFALDRVLGPSSGTSGTSIPPDVNR
jgi:TetR/AcrR family transcriptional regulator, transcriptional repressor for nem operon